MVNQMIKQYAVSIAFLMACLVYAAPAIRASIDSNFHLQTVHHVEHEVGMVALREVVIEEYNFGKINKYKDFILQAAYIHDLDPNLIAAIILTESSGRWSVRGSGGEYGLMQIMPFHFPSSYSDRKRLDPFTNIMYGSKILREMMDRKNGNIELAISAYNTGQYARWINRRYVGRVQSYHSEFEKQKTVYIYHIEGVASR